MKECWNDDRDSRPTFLELKEEFDSLISQEERYNYLLLSSEACEAVECVMPAPQSTEHSDSSPNEESGASNSAH